MESHAASRWVRRISLAAILVLVLVLIYYAARRVILGPDQFTIEQTTPLVSAVDGMKYRVHEGHAAPQKAADTLAELNLRVIDLMRFLRGRYVRNPDGKHYPERRDAVRRLLMRYNPDNLAENSPRDPTGDTSYTIDKGAIVALCLRDRGSATIHDFDTLMFVTLHEMAHIAIEDIDHPPRFWSAFRFLLEEAEEGGIYESPDFLQHPRWYCGVNIDYNPRFDPNVQSI